MFDAAACKQASDTYLTWKLTVCILPSNQGRAPTHWLQSAHRGHELPITSSHFLTQQQIWEQYYACTVYPAYCHRMCHLMTWRAFVCLQLTKQLGIQPLQVEQYNSVHVCCTVCWVMPHHLCLQMNSSQRLALCTMLENIPSSSSMHNQWLCLEQADTAVAYVKFVISCQLARVSLPLPHTTIYTPIVLGSDGSLNKISKPQIGFILANVERFRIRK